MRKELYQMLEMIVKTATENRMKIINVRSNPACTSETILEAIDSKRALQIILKTETIAEGHYKLAKTEQNYTLIPTSEEFRDKFPEVDRIIYADAAIKFSRSVYMNDYHSTMAKTIAYFGVMQEIQTPNKQEHGVNIIMPLRLNVLKPWMSKDIAKDMTTKAKSASYPIQLESETEKLKITFVVMPDVA